MNLPEYWTLVPEECCSRTQLQQALQQAQGAAATNKEVQEGALPDSAESVLSIWPRKGLVVDEGLFLQDLLLAKQPQL